MLNTKEQIKNVWAVEQEILDVIDQVCRENQLRYSLAYGTLIGAVRHKGFIPWDDDIDLAMPREDYEKLLAIWEDAAPAGYLLQNTRTDADFTQTFTKIRKDHTTFLQDEDEARKHYHKGVFVDIFPFDRVAPEGMSRRVQYVASAVNLLYSRGFTSGSGGMVGMAERILIRMPGGMKRKLKAWAERYIQRWEGQEECLLFSPSTIQSARCYYPERLFDAMGTIRFCGKNYMCAEDWDAFLRADYGDYMQLPPESERVWTHHPLIIDFTHNYEELSQDEA